MKKPAILITERDEPLRRRLKALMLHHGYEVIEASKSTEALQAFHHGHVDLMVLNTCLMDSSSTLRMREDLPPPHWPAWPTQSAFIIWGAPLIKVTLRRFSLPKAVKGYASILREAVERHGRANGTRQEPRCVDLTGTCLSEQLL